MSDVGPSISGMAAELIGRDHPVGVLRAEISRATESHGGLVLVTGEAGIGKTTLVTDAMDVARRGGALVLSGSCWDSSAAPGFWPWVQVVRGLRRQAREDEWTAAEQAAGGQLSFLLGDAGANEPADGFGRYDAVTSALVAVSQRRPVVVVLDDLHWADPSSVRLLEFVAQHTWYERLLLVGTYRDVEVEAADHPLAPLMLPLLAKATTVTLTGLGRDEVGALMTRTVGDAPDPELVGEVHLRTGGNPFFVEQTARLWRSGGSVTAVAPGVRDAVRRRLSLLPETVSRLLTGAAVLGREFHRQVLAASVSAPVAQVDRQLSQAVSARLVSALGDGRFAFAHDLVRETLYESLAEADVPARHAAVVRAMDRSPTLTERIFPADLARHAYLGRGELDTGRVVDALAAAGQDAGRRFAFEESAGHYRRALELLDDTDPRRVKIGLELGVQLHHFGRPRRGVAVVRGRRRDRAERRRRGAGADGADAVRAVQSGRAGEARGEPAAYGARAARAGRRRAGRPVARPSRAGADAAADRDRARRRRRRHAGVRPVDAARRAVGAGARGGAAGADRRAGRDRAAHR